MRIVKKPQKTQFWAIVAGSRILRMADEPFRILIRNLKGQLGAEGSELFVDCERILSSNSPRVFEHPVTRRRGTNWSDLLGEYSDLRFVAELMGHTRFNEQALISDWCDISELTKEAFYFDCETGEFAAHPVRPVLYEIQNIQEIVDHFRDLGHQASIPRSMLAQNLYACTRSIRECKDVQARLHDYGARRKNLMEEVPSTDEINSQITRESELNLRRIDRSLTEEAPQVWRNQSTGCHDRLALEIEQLALDAKALSKAIDYLPNLEKIEKMEKRIRGPWTRFQGKQDELLPFLNTCAVETKSWKEDILTQLDDCRRFLKSDSINCEQLDRDCLLIDGIGEQFTSSSGLRFSEIHAPDWEACDGRRILAALEPVSLKQFRHFASRHTGSSDGWLERCKEIHATINESALSDDMAVIGLGCEAYNDYCDWLTQMDRHSGIIGEVDFYRLPTDYEWSCMAGIGEFENPSSCPLDKSDVKYPELERRKETEFRFTTGRILELCDTRVCASNGEINLIARGGDGSGEGGGWNPCRRFQIDQRFEKLKPDGLYWAGVGFRPVLHQSNKKRTQIIVPDGPSPGDLLEVHLPVGKLSFRYCRFESVPSSVCSAKQELVEASRSVALQNDECRSLVEEFLEFHHEPGADSGYWMAESPLTERQLNALLFDPYHTRGSDFPGCIEKYDDGRVLSYKGYGMWSEDVCSWSLLQICRSIDEHINQALGFRAAIPTESMWENACLAGREAEQGQDLDYLMPASYGAVSLEPIPSDQRTANPWGLCGMLGNLWEITLMDRSPDSDRRLTYGSNRDFGLSGNGRFRQKGGSVWSDQRDCHRKVSMVGLPCFYEDLLNVLMLDFRRQRYFSGQEMFLDGRVKLPVGFRPALVARR